MYRDSFGNALLPYMAEVYETAYFSRALPYQLQDLAQHQADTLIIERAERFLPDMAQEAPYMEAPDIEIPLADIETGTEKTLEIADLRQIKQGDFIQVTGTAPADALKDNSRIYIRVNGSQWYEAFPVSDADGREGFSLLLPIAYDTENKFELFLME